MAQTNAQLLAQAKAQLAATKARLQAAQDEQAILNASTQPGRVDTSTLTGIAAASKGTTGSAAPVDTWATAKVGTSGLTQAQLDAQANAIATAKEIGGTVIANPDGPGVKVVAPTADTVVKKTVVNPVNPADPASGLMTKEQWDALQAQAAADAATANEKRDAFALIQQTMQGYGFTTEEWNQLSKYIEDALINPKIGPNQMVLEMRALPVYKARFAGNETRVAAGLNALSEANYIQQENSYAEYFKAGGIANLGTRSMYAKLIGGAVAPTEVGKRINLAVDRVQNSDPQIMEQLTGYYTNITKSDLVGYFLDPTTVLPELEKKVTTAEIGTAAKEAGMDYGLERIAGLQAYGVDRAQAIAGYGNIGQVLPTSTKLGNIYSESGVKYDQTAGEAEFLKSDANAIEKRRQLKSLERSQFMGDSGVNAQVGSLNKNTQGAF